MALSFNDLSHYDAIVVGIRGYELRPDLPRTNARLLDYVKNGGSLVVQYQREAVWSKYDLAPYPSTMDGAKSNGEARTTDANSPVEFFASQNPLLNTPNKITSDDFQGMGAGARHLLLGHMGLALRANPWLSGPGRADGERRTHVRALWQGGLYLCGPGFLPRTSCRCAWRVPSVR